MTGRPFRYNKPKGAPASSRVKKSGPNESARTKKLKDAIQAAHPGSKWWKNHGSEFVEKGLPDLMGTVNGHMYGLEIKVDPGWFSVQQIKRLRELTIAGATAGGIIWTDGQWKWIPVTSMGHEGDRKRETWISFQPSELISFRSV